MGKMLIFRFIYSECRAVEVTVVTGVISKYMFIDVNVWMNYYCYFFVVALILLRGI